MKETRTLVVCRCKLLLPLKKKKGAGSVSVLTPPNVYMNHYQGLDQDYLNMMPLKHAIAFIYEFLFFFSLFILFDVV